MIIDNLYNEVLIDPLKEGVNELFVVSGYASATFCRRHIEELLEVNQNFKLNYDFNTTNMLKKKRLIVTCLKMKYIIR